MGFCLFNNVAIAAQHALDDGAQRVLVLDWDVHHGNGTNDIFHSRDDVLFASIHQSPLYPGTGPADYLGDGPGEGYTVNLPVPPGSGSEEFLALVQHVVAPIARSFAPDLIVISAGFDAHRDDPLCDLGLSSAAFGDLTRAVRGIGPGPVLILEGGYDLNALFESVTEVLAALQ
jgi:acetoin utilization deacetylase AcuC-like enzyme